MTTTSVALHTTYRHDHKVCHTVIDVDFVEWNNNGIILTYPQKWGGAVGGQPWIIPYELLSRFIRAGLLKIDGYIPEQAIKEIEKHDAFCI